MKKQQTMIEKIMSVYLTLNLIDRLFCNLRLLIVPVEEIVKFSPKYGNLLDIGCGYGFISNAIAISNPHLKVYGIDINKYRIKLAQQTINKRNNINFSIADVKKKLNHDYKFNAILCADLLHHIEKKYHIKIISEVYGRLEKKGIFIIKEIDTMPLYKYYWNYAHDFVVNKGQLIYCRSHSEWITILRKKGFRIKSLTFSKKGWLYPHFMIVAIKP